MFHVKRWQKRLCLLLSLLALAGCGRHPEAAELAGKTYRYEKSGFGGDFTITLEEDGSFTYYEGSLSSYIGIGTWTLEGDILCITDEGAGKSWKNYFRAEKDALTFREEGSENFLYLKVADGEKFTVTE